MPPPTLLTGRLAKTLCAVALLTASTHAAQALGGMLELRGEFGGWAGTEHLGQTLVPAHDFDLDGTPDLLTSWQVPAAGTTEVGVFSSRDGRLLHQIALPRLHSLHHTEALASIRDVDGDGVPEIAVGEQHYPFTTARGIVQLFSGASGQVLWSLSSPTSYDHLGSGLAAVGDVNLDGYDDLLVHASTMRWQPPISPSGVALLLSGLDGSELRRFEVADQYQQYAGQQHVAAAGDVDHDGVPDLLVSGGGDLYYSLRARVALFSGATGLLIREHVANSDTGSLGVSIAFAGDVDRDGTPDYAVADDGAGAVWVHSGATGAILLRSNGPPSVEFGIGLSGGRDLDGDEVPDLLITERRTALLHVVSGATGEKFLLIGGGSGPDRPGFRACPLGDADRDGRLEFAWSGAESALPGAPASSGFIRIAEFVRGLESSRSTLSAAAGGTVQWLIEFPRVEAHRPYRLLASGRGTTGGLFEGVHVPLDQDGVFTRMLTGPPRGFLFAVGTLDASAQATAQLHLPSGAAQAWLGSTLWFAAVVGPPSARHGSSVAIPLTIRP